MNECLCGCGQQAAPGASFAGEDEAARNRHRATRAGKSKKAAREEEQARIRREELLVQHGLARLPLAQLCERALMHQSLADALVHAAVERAGKCDEVSVEARVAAATAALTQRLGELEGELVATRQERDKIRAAAQSLEERAAQADRDAAAAQKVADRLARLAAT
jgi:hypothetical protein